MASDRISPVPARFACNLIDRAFACPLVREHRAAQLPLFSDEALVCSASDTDRNRSGADAHRGPTQRPHAIIDHLACRRSRATAHIVGALSPSAAPCAPLLAGFPAPRAPPACRVAWRLPH